MKTKSKNILSTFLNRLTNLTGTNRSILLLRLSSEQTIDFSHFNFLQNGNSFSIIRSLMAGRAAKLCPILDSRLASSNDVSTKLKRLQRIDRFIYEERGSNDLHVGWPFVRGKFSDGTLVRAPLLFFPVSLAAINNQWVLQLREDAGTVLNKSFALAYSFYNKVELPEELMETSFEDFDDDSTVWRTELYQLLKDKIELNFNPDNFRDELTPFEEFNRQSYEELHHAGELKLFPEAVLGIFPQAGSQLVPDYQYLMNAEEFTDLEDFFLKRKESALPLEGETPQPDDLIKEEKLYTTFPVDGWQENAIKEIKKGKSIVVQGPPGTGKSQLICNLISDAIASGKKVLVVCQKRAALDVVFQRLSEMDLEDFLGLLHDFRNDRKVIFEKIARQISRIDDYKAFNRSVDIIQTERKFFQLCRRIDQIVEELDEFKQALYDEGECGLSVKELYLKSDLNGDTINIKQEYQYFRYTETEEFLRKVRSFLTYAERYQHDNYPWSNRKSFSSYGLSDMKEIMDTLRDMPIFSKQIANKIDKIISAELSLADCESLLGKEDDILGMLSVLKDDSTYQFFQLMLEDEDEETSLLWLSNVERVFMSCYEGGGPEITTPPDQLGKLQLALKQLMDSRRGLIRFFRWEIFSENKYWIKRVLVANDLPYNREGFKQLETRLDSRLNLEHHLTALKERKWLNEIPAGYERKDFRMWFERKKLALRAKLIFNSLREVKDIIKPQKCSRYSFNRIFHDLLSIASEIPERKTAWLKYLTPYQLRQLANDPSRTEDYLALLNKDFDNLCEFDKLKESLQEHELNVIQKLFDQVGQWDYVKIEAVFENSLSLAWIDFIETKYPILRIASTIKIEELQAELRQLVKEKERVSKEIVLLRAREQVYEKIEYNRLNNRVTYRDLHHQVSKKKKLWPVRKVIMEFQDDLLRLVPCWLTSPEAISAIFPMKEMFDLVIFDEASQCFAERGIPAMYRGKQILVAGDSKQLKPFELYQVRWDEENEHPDSEVDSLLELADRYLPTVYLQEHYRSQTPELIDFSNRHFYDGRLKLLPDRVKLNLRQPGIEFLKVDGQWENNTNGIEAEYVVKKVMSLLSEYPGMTIGVVTFNAPQQMLVMDLLEEEASKAGSILPASLFVKNIENVQGDEKDVIIFSVGYAPDKNGKMNMQFGSLNVAGGENRLNVAITRARMQVLVVSSIWPEQLQVQESKNEGPKLLKAYLEFARHVSSGGFEPKVHGPQRRSPSWYLKTKLSEMGVRKFQDVTFHENTLPFTDVCFLHQGNYLGAILTDDERYYNSLSAKDGHAYTMNQLSKKNWTYRMIYSRNYWLDREKIESDLQLLIGAQKG